MIYFLAMLWITLGIFFVVTKNYKKEEFKDYDKSKHPLITFYPTAKFVTEHIPVEKIMPLSAKSDTAMRRLYPKGEYAKQRRIFILKRLSLIYTALLAAVTIAALAELSVITQSTLRQKHFLVRPDGIEKQVKLRVNAVENGRSEEDEITISIQPAGQKEQTEAEKNAKKTYQETYEYIDEKLLNNNQDLSSICTDLCLVTSIPESGARVTWSTKPEGVIGADGRVKNKELTKPVQVMLCGQIYDSADVHLGDYQVEVNVLPFADYEQSEWRKKLVTSIQEEEAKETESALLELPNEFSGKTLSWEEIKESDTLKILLMGAIAIVLLYFLMEQKLQDQLKDRRKQMMLDYPEIVNKLALLIGAGMTVTGAWDRVTGDYIQLQKENTSNSSNGKKHKRKKSVSTRYAYEEMIITGQELKLGITEAKCLEDFGKRAGIVEYMKLSTVLIQNLKKGTDGLTTVLELMSEEAFETRKQMAKQLGEEAGSKMLLPMGIMLILVLIIIMVPAFMSMQI